VRARVRFAGQGIADALLPALSHRLDEGPGPVRGTITVVPGPEPTLSIDRARRELLCRVNETPAWWERAAPLRLALSWLLVGERRRVVYAAAVGDGRGCALLVGARGSGKTTAALAAVRAGLGFLADDYVLLQAGPTYDATSLYGTAATPEQSDGHAKTVLDVESLVPGSVRELLPVRAVVLPRVVGGRSRWRPASPATALRRWAPTTVFQMPLDKGAAVPMLGELVRRVPCYELNVGDDQSELAGALDGLLDRAVSS
jgi:hypothetical protein